MNNSKKVLVAGCFDLLHPGQMKFLLKAASLGSLYVSLGSDSSIIAQKNKSPVYDEQERLFMLQNIKCVHWVELVSDPSPLGFREHILKIKPDIFVINDDGDTPAKEALCRGLGVDYRVFARDHFDPLHPTSSTQLAQTSSIPSRVSLCSGFMDNPMVNGRVSSSKGSLVVITIEPFKGLRERSGMATSTIATVHRFFGGRLPTKYPLDRLAEMIYCLENPPPKRHYISGSLDSRGIIGSGIQLFSYERQTPHPASVEVNLEESDLQWVEQHVYLKHAYTRPDNCKIRLRNEHAQASQFCEMLHHASMECWEAIRLHDVRKLANAVQRSHCTQKMLVENHCPPDLENFILKEQALGAMIMGAGGGGYVAFISEKPPQDSIRIRVRRAEL